MAVQSYSDVAGAAAVLIQQRGNEAEPWVAQQAEFCLDVGDARGCALWKRVGAAIHQMVEQQPQARPNA